MAPLKKKKSHVQLCPSKGLFPISQSISWADLAAETPGGGLPDNRPTSRGLVWEILWRDRPGPLPGRRRRGGKKRREIACALYFFGPLSQKLPLFFFFFFWSCVASAVRQSIASNYGYNALNWLNRRAARLLCGKLLKGVRRGVRRGEPREFACVCVVCVCRRLVRGGVRPEWSTLSGTNSFGM